MPVCSADKDALRFGFVSARGCLVWGFLGILTRKEPRSSSATADMNH